MFKYQNCTCPYCGQPLLPTDDLAVCPECGRESYIKQLSAAGFQLKGSGWYATDFKGGAKPAAKPEGLPPCQGGTASCACNPS